MQHNTVFIGYHFALSETDPWKDLLIAELAEIGFDMFEDHANGFTAWGLESEVQTDNVHLIISRYNAKTQISYTTERQIQQNWNEEWEKHFSPVEIPGFLYIKAPFHPDKEGFDHIITIYPKMAFGTGHHSTTYGMCMLMRAMDFKGKNVLDMGCGTGILGILALKSGAAHATGIDIDEWAVANTMENALLNHVDLTVYKGDANSISGTFDIVLANIQRNVLLADIPKYVHHMNMGGSLLVSGFYDSDFDEIHRVCLAHHLRLNNRFQLNNWLSLHYTYKKEE